MNDQEGESRKELVYVRPAADDSYSESDEISLVDLWLVLARRKWVILGITVLCLALGLGYILMKPVEYEYTTGVKLSRAHTGAVAENAGMLFINSGETDLLEDPAETVALLNDVIIPEQRKVFLENRGSVPGIQVSTQEKKNRLSLNTTAKPENAALVERFQKAVAEALVKNHASLLKNEIELRIKPFKKRAAALKQQIESLEENLQMVSNQEYEGEGNGVQKLIDAQQKSELRQDLAEARLKLTEVQSASEVVREASRPTRISFLADKSGESVGPSKSLVTGLSLVLGLMVGVFAVFFLEFLGHARAAARRED
ncbi:MAG: hypothetical protein K9K82_12650 [Desulfobacteraceae bacterium]|nr:hypothetical protein [Desulfobacteraceae bacterium]